MTAGSSWPRRLAVFAIALLVTAAAAVFVLRTRSTETPPGTTPPEAPSATTSPSPSSPSPPTADLTLLQDPARAEAAGAAAVLAAARQASTTDWVELTDSSWQSRVARERPVYVGRLRVSEQRSQVEGDVVIVLPAGAGGPLRLRFLPGAAALAEAGASASAEVWVDGRPVAATIDPDAALLVIADVEPSGEEPVLVRVTFGYHVPTQQEISAREGPAGFGILTRSAAVTMLGHGLPLLVFDDHPMVDWGDVGGFPVALWSLQVEADGHVVTGGDESSCPPPATEPCQWSRGTALRDMAVAVLDADAAFEIVDDHGVHGGPGTSPEGIDGVLQEVRHAFETMTSRLGPLPWTDFDVVLAPLAGAAGMEFPGLVVVDPEYLDRLEGGFGTYVIAHEVAHQWFHALVGNSSLSDPVVDESLSQYATVWYFRDQLGDEAADRMVERYLTARYRRAKSDGVPERAPGSTLADFGGNRVYGPMVYARAPFAWLVADDQLGEPALVRFLQVLVADRGLGQVTAAEVRELARAEGLAALVAAIDRWWFDPAPVLDELP